MSKRVNTIHMRQRHPLLTNIGCIVGGPKYELWGPVVAGTDVRYIGFTAHQMLGAAEVTQLEDACFRVKQQVLWLDVSVTHSQRVDVSQTPEQLVHVQLWPQEEE